MIEYFTSYVLKERTNDERNHVNTGYGQMISEVSGKRSAADVIKSVTTSISKEWGVREESIHIIQFNKL